MRKQADFVQLSKSTKATLYILLQADTRRPWGSPPRAGRMPPGCLLPCGSAPVGTQAPKPNPQPSNPLKPVPGRGCTRAGPLLRRGYVSRGATGQARRGSRAALSSQPCPHNPALNPDDDAGTLAACGSCSSPRSASRCSGTQARQRDLASCRAQSKHPPRPSDPPPLPLSPPSLPRRQARG